MLYNHKELAVSRNLSLPLLASAFLGGTAALADSPKVATDIAPVHALVARVMDGLGTPALIVPAGASPHEYTLRPSEAAALQEADLVFMIGAELTPWLEGAIGTLATDAVVTEFLHAGETQLLELRESALFEAHVHGEDGHRDGEDHGHDDHDEHEAADHDQDAHDEQGEGHNDHDEAHDDHGEDHPDHDEDHHDHDDHGYGGHDTHVWLSPENARAWLNLIAARLSAADPENAGTYFANATAGQAEIDALVTEVNGILDPVRGMSFIVFHDAYQYFETSFDVPAAGAISLSDASEPGPARIAEIRDRIRAEGIDCVLTEPQFNAGLVATVLDGTEAGTAVIDPLGSALAPSGSFYAELLRSLAASLAACDEN